MLRASARDHQRIRHQVEAPLDEIAANQWDPLDSAASRRNVAGAGVARLPVPQEAGKSLLAGSDEHGIGMFGRLVGQ